MPPLHSTITPVGASAPALENQLLELFLYMGSAWVLYLLLGLSVLSLALVFERFIHFVWTREDLAALQVALSNKLDHNDIAAAKQCLAASRSHAAHISLRGLQALDRGPACVEEIIEGATALARVRMERGLAFLGTLGNNAPFIGLFGTVLGIIRAFRDLAADTIEGSSAVMAGISEALVATAVGLLVALPAVALFNLFQRAIKSRLASSQALSRIVLAHAKTERK